METDDNTLWALLERAKEAAEAETEDFGLLCQILSLDPKVDFVEADLRGLNLQNQTLKKCNFQGTDFTGSDCSTTIFEDCNLQGASFANSNIYGASFSNCVIDKVDFTGTDLSQAVFSDTTAAFGPVDIVQYWNKIGETELSE